MLLPVCLSPTPLPALTSWAALTALMVLLWGSFGGGCWEMWVPGRHYFFLSMVTDWCPLVSLLHTKEEMVPTS